jgi:hypothetical protein
VVLHQVVWGQLTTWVVDEDEGQIIDCLEHVNCCVCCFNVPHPPSLFLTLLRVVQALAWTKARVNNRAMAAVQSTCNRT